jgi:membrane protease YdiL (CAAX protease family)
VTSAGVRVEPRTAARVAWFYPALALYTVAIAAGELSLPVVGVVPVAQVDAALMVVLVAHATMLEGPPRRLLAALGLVALLRTVSAAAAVPGLPAWGSYAAVGVPLLAALLFARTRLGTRPRHLPVDGSSPTSRGLNFLMVAMGLPASLIGYAALQPTALLAHPDPGTWLLAAAALVAGAAAVEELLFRGILQAPAIDTLGGSLRGVLYAAGMCTLLYLGVGSVAYLGLMLVLALVWGFSVARGASLWSTTASHGLLLIGMGLVWPILLR